MTTMDRSPDKPFRLYRDTSRSWIAGVCAGIADYFGVGVGLVRFLTFAAFVFFFIPTVVGYAALAFLVKPKPGGLYSDAREEAFWRGVATDPPQTFQSLRRKFQDLEQRLGRMEALVTSDEFDLRRKFRDLGN
jgi:phage shock protein C